MGSATETNIKSRKASDVETLHHLHKGTVFRYHDTLYVVTEGAFEGDNKGDDITVKRIATYGDEGMISLGGMFFVKEPNEENFNAYNRIRLIDKMWTVVN